LPLTPAELSAPELGKVMRELFQDFVAVKALKLPLGQRCDDYEVRAGHNTAGTMEGAFLYKKSNGKESMVVRDIQIWVDANTNLKQFWVRALLLSFASSLALVD
jgi:hypothetical protein